MSYITFDYKCPKCGHVESRFVQRTEMDMVYHHGCGTQHGEPKMVRLPAGTRTHFRFNDTKLKD